MNDALGITSKFCGIQESPHEPAANHRGRQAGDRVQDSVPGAAQLLGWHHEVVPLE
jgi:hypothetical protein